MGTQRLSAPVELRPFRWADLPHIVSIWNAACRADGVPQPADPAALEAQWRARPGQAQHTITAWLDDEIIGYCWATPGESTATGAVQAQGSGRVLPQHRGRGVGAALVAGADALLAAVLPTGTPLMIERIVDVRLERDLRLLQAMGYAAAKRIVRMEITFTPAGIRPPRTTEGVRLQPFSPADHAALFSACLGAQADPRPYSAASQIACDAAGQVIGAAFAAADGDAGQIGHVFIRADYRREGLAGALVLAALRALHGAGLASASAWLDELAQPGVRALYELAGMRLAEGTESRRRWLSGAG